MKKMIQSRDGNLQLLLARSKTNSRKNLGVRNKYRRQKLLQIITPRRLPQGRRFALDLVNIPLWHIF
jgi:hypothetical protein